MKQKNAKQLWKRRLSMGLSLAMAVTMLPAGSLTALADDEGDAQDTLLKARSTTGVVDETYTHDQPFISNVTGATKDGEGRPYFSSPAFAVKETIDNSHTEGNCTIPTVTGDTMLIAAAEGKFNQNRKAGGTDVIAAVSTDKGATWIYSYPLRFPDSEGDAGVHATSINNPTLTVGSDGTIYCLMNVTPTGVSSLAAEGDGFTYPAVGTGYVTVGTGDNAKKRLALFDASVTDQDISDLSKCYYVGDYENVSGEQLAKVLKGSDNQPTDYAIDQWFNLYKKGSNDAYEAITQKRATATGDNNAADNVQQNVFYKGSELHVYATSYIVCVTSTDGLEWSAPEILNPYVKKDDGKSLVVAGGKGLATSKKRIVFPVYRNNDGTNADGKASIIWLDKSDGGDNEWHRSDDIPEFATGDDEDAPGSWIGQGEIVELSDGKLRMVFSNDQGLISYADATRDDANKFVFSAPVMTGTRSPEGAHPSVVSYLNPIDERKGLLIAAPVGTDRTTGRIMTFLSTGSGVTGDGDDAAAGGMTRVEGTDVPDSSEYFQNPCMDQFNAGNNIGLLWEKGAGDIQFNNFGILDVVKNHYIPHVTVDVELAVGESYERTYTVSGQDHMNGVTTKPDSSVATYSFTPGTPQKEMVPALYPHKILAANNETCSSLDVAFPHTEEDIANMIDQTIERAEFTITRPDNNKPDEYEVYAALDRRYYLGPESGNEFSATKGSNIIITKNPAEYNTNTASDLGIEDDEFSILLTNDQGKLRRLLIFYAPRLRIDKQGGWLQNKNNADYGVILLQKMGPDEKLEGEDAKLELISGYKKVSEITPNEKYLIAYVPKETGGPSVALGGEYFKESDNQTPIFILYPRNPGSADNGLSSFNVKLVYGTREVERRAQKELRITAVKGGTTTLVANHITYNITCHETEINLEKNAKRFYPNISASECSVSGNNVVKIEDCTQKEPSLFNCLKKADSSFEGYSTTAEGSLNMSGAEFIIERSGEPENECYTVQSVLNNKYLSVSGTGKDQYFSTAPVVFNVKRSNAAGKVEFRFQRYDNKRNMYFHYPWMIFDAYQEESSTQGNYYFELLEKQEYISNADEVPGYRRVDTITPGKVYLITHPFHQTATDTRPARDARIILYPNDTDQVSRSKIFEYVETSGVQITAIGNTNDTVTLTMKGNSYTVKITGECLHAGYGRYIGDEVLPTCTTAGNSGNTYCENCDGVVLKGTEKAALGHKVADDAWTVKEGSEPTFEKDGLYAAICQRCAEEVTKTYPIAEYATNALAEKASDARKYNKGDYTEKSYKPLEDALAKVADVADTVEAKKALYNELDAAINGLESKTEFENVKNQLTEKLSKIKEALAKEQSEFDPDVWTALNDAVDALKAAEIGIDLSELDEADIDKELDKLPLTVLNTAWDAVKNVSTNTIKEEEEEAKRTQLKNNIKDALSQADAKMEGGQGSYTDDSWKKLTDAYSAANLSDTVLEALSTEELENLLKNLTDAIAGLTGNTTGDPTLDAAKKAVDDAVKAADAIANAGQGNYSKETWDAFIAAYNAAKNAPANADAAALQKLADALVNAQKALKAADANEFVKGATEDVGKIRYQVLDANKKTVTVKLGLNKKATSIKIPATVKVKGVTCKVTQIGSNAFKGYNKATKLTIGKNVTTIGKKAFMNCKKLKTVTLKGKVLKSIKANAFKGTSKKKVTVKWPKGLKASKKKSLKNAFKKRGLKVK